MLELKAPEYSFSSTLDKLVGYSNAPLLFLAGGISLCPDWQEEMANQLKDSKIVIFNPRRNDMTNNYQEIVKQIKWEKNHIDIATMVSFWFPKESICPITLLEFGKVLVQQDKKMFVGIEDSYVRRLDLVEQLALHRPEVHWVNSISKLVDQIKRHVCES